MKFEWDAAKASSNLFKHRLSFQEGFAAFNDKRAISWDDLTHSIAEQRRVRIGRTKRGILAVAYTIRGERVRLISVRFASRQERRLYAYAQR